MFVYLNDCPSDSSSTCLVNMYCFTTAYPSATMTSPAKNSESHIQHFRSRCLAPTQTGSFAVAPRQLLLHGSPPKWPKGDDRQTSGGNSILEG
mmetsp:Transcript_3431/g.7913  ORF Transcript_3431/g.7913 Transcript_3431/m.7913 type:complete len:93 (+) Transcript_3431:324-602(+)